MIAKKANIGYGTIYAHFPKKEDLLFAQTIMLMQDYVDGPESSASLPPIADGQNHIDYILSLSDRVWDLLGMLPSHLLSLYLGHRWACDEQAYLQSNQVRDQMLQQFTALITKAQASGDIHTSIDAQKITFIIDAVFVKSVQMARFNNKSLQEARSLCQEHLRFMLEATPRI